MNQEIRKNKQKPKTKKKKKKEKKERSIVSKVSVNSKDLSKFQRKSAHAPQKELPDRKI